MNISNRVRLISFLTEGYNKLLDIGTDHAYIPINAILNEFVHKAIASDINPLPLKSAIENVNRCNLNDRVEVVQADGLNSVDNDCDVVTIAGMGGLLITEIIKNGDFKNIKRIIIQPNNHAYEVRSIMQKLHYKIVEEYFITEKTKYYPIIVFEKGDMSLSETELSYGPLLIKNKDEVLLEYANRKLKRLTKIVDSVKEKNKRKQILKDISMLEGVVNASF